MAQTIVSVGERDAFGREIGEDTLKEMGWSGSATPPRQEPPRTAPPPQWTKPPSGAPASPPTPAPPTATPFDMGEAWSMGGGQKATPAAIKTAATAPPSVPLQRYQGRRRRGSFSKLIFLMIVIVLAAAGAGMLIQLGGDAVDRGQRALRDAIPTAVPVTKPPAVEAPTSFFSTASVRKALAELPGGRVTMLTISPGSLSATGKRKIVHMSADGSVTTIASPTAIPGKAIKVDPAAPSRIARTIAKRTRSEIESMTLTSIIGPAQWNITLANGRRYTASANGTHVKRG